MSAVSEALWPPMGEGWWEAMFVRLQQVCPQEFPLPAADLVFEYDNGDSNMLVAPAEQSHVPPRNAAAHDAHLAEPDTIAPAPNAAMDVATVDASSAPAASSTHLDVGTAPQDGSQDADAFAAILNATRFPDPTAPLTAPMPSLEPPISLAADMPMDVDANTATNMALHMDMNPDTATSMAMDIGTSMPLAAVTAPDYTMNGHADPIPGGEQQLSAFARLRFDDGSYYMHTYQIILGRNVHLAHKDMRRLAKVEQLKAKGEQQRAQALLDGRHRKRAGARSVISEAGGIVNAPIDMMPKEYQQRRQSIASQSLASTGSVPKDESGPEPDHAPQEMLMQAFPEAPDTFDSHVPEDPNDCPIVPIHPQHITDRTGLRGPKGISRQHAKIFYDFDNGNFCLAVLGSNGLYHEDTFLEKGTCVELNHGDTITIGMVQMSFFLPDIALTDEQRNHQDSGSHSRPMSFSFENGQGESEDMDDSGSEDLSVNPRHVYHYPMGSDLESEDDGIAEDDDDMEDLEDDYSPAPRAKPSLKLTLKNKREAPPSKPSKITHKQSQKSGVKRKAAREPSPEEPPPKKVKPKVKEACKEPPREKDKAKASKGPAKAPAKQPAKTPAKSPKDRKSKSPSPVHERSVETQPPAALGSPPATGVSDAANAEGNLNPNREGVITEEMADRLHLPKALIGQPLPDRKGPGRPPKDGLMSKRQRSQLIKQGKEIEKAKAAGIDPADIPQPTVKPKMARRKGSNAGDEEDVRESTEKGDGFATSGDKKQSKPAKPARSPSPEMRIEDYTEEQLQRPPSNYIVLIHEAISSASTGEMNLQQIYNYIEKTYPWFKFKTTTSGWQSSVRHNLGQHDAFVKGDKEGKGYMWKINPLVSIEKERRKKQASPPRVSNAQRPYYPPPSAYPPFGQPSYYQGMPHPLGNAPRPPPSVEPVQRRLPPSMVGASNSTSSAAPSPYASPWAGGNTAGSPSSQPPPRPYASPASHTPPVSAGAPASGQYGVLYPTTAPPASSATYTAAGAYGSPYQTVGPTASPYPSTPGQPYTPYPPTGASHQNRSAPAPAQGNSVKRQSVPPNAPPNQHDGAAIPHPSDRYSLSTNPDLIRQLEAFRTVYLQTRIEPGEETKVDNAIRAYVTPDLESTLTPQERHLLASIKTIPTLKGLSTTRQSIKVEDSAHAVHDQSAKNSHVPAPPIEKATETATATATAAAIAADAAANTVPDDSSTTAPASSASEPQKSAPSMASMSSAPNNSAAPARVQTQRPSVEPLTPVPGSPAVQNGTPVKPLLTEVAAASSDSPVLGAQEKVEKVENAAIPDAGSVPSKA